MNAGYSDGARARDVRQPFPTPWGSRSSRTLPARRPHGVLYSRSPSSMRTSFYLRACTKEWQAARTDPSAALDRIPSANEGAAMANVPLARPAWADKGGAQPSARERLLLGEATGRTAFSRFNPPASGRIAGSVAAQRTYEQGLAASGPDGTLVLMPPVARAMSQGDGTRIKQREHPELHAGQPGPRRITFGERKNDMSSPKDPYCAAAQRRARPHAPLTNARSASEAVRIVFRPPSNDAISGVPDGSLAASGG
jgi:hypothetical protein